MGAALLAGAFAAPQAYAANSGGQLDGTDYVGIGPDYNVTIEEDVSGRVYGSYSGKYGGTGSNGTLTVNSGTVSDNAYGGHIRTYGAGIGLSGGAATAANNKITVNGGSGRLYDGGYVQIEEAPGSASATAADNDIIFNDGTVALYLTGGIATASIGRMGSGQPVSATAERNTVTVRGGLVDASIIVADAYANGWGNGATATATAKDNTLTISGGTVDTCIVYGALASADAYMGSNTGNTATAVASGNTVIFDGAPNMTAPYSHCKILGGEVRLRGENFPPATLTATATDNTIQLGRTLAASTLANFALTGGAGCERFVGTAVSVNSDCTSGNMLSVLGSGLQARAVNNFEKYEFGTSAFSTSTPALTLSQQSGALDIDASKVSFDDNATLAALNVNDTITLLASNAGITISPSTTPVSLQGYDFELSASANKLILKVLKVPPSYTVTGAADPTAGGTLACTSPVEHGKDTTCTVTTNKGYTFDKSASVAPAGKATVTCTDTECAVSGVTDNVTVTGKFTLNSYTVTGDASTGGTMNCTPATATYFDTITCTPTADAGYTFDQAADTDPAGKATVACTATECKISDVTDNIKVLGVFKLLPSGNATAVPTLGGAGLAFTSLALSAFAAPALRRRKKQGKKSDTLR